MKNRIIEQLADRVFPEATRELCARELHTVARRDGQCRCGVFYVGQSSKK